MTEKLYYFSKQDYVTSTNDKIISLHIIPIYSFEHCPGSMNV